jgi:aspartate/glutamate racemase
VVSPVFEFHAIGEFIKKICGDKVILGCTEYGLVQNTTNDVESDVLKTSLVSPVLKLITSLFFNNKVISPTLYP